MRSLVEDEEEEFAPVKRDGGLMLGSGTLLGIFFGLVMVCGLFFGLGYSVGHRSAVDAEAQAGLERPVQAASVAGELRAKPSAATAPEPVGGAVSEPVSQAAAAGVQEQADAEASTTPDNGNPSAWPPDAARTEKPTAGKLLQPAIAEKPVVEKVPASTPDKAAGAGIGAVPPGVMVQIAAISNAGDADVLVKALGRHGYTPSVRKDEGDAFLHVQVGPFASRAEARAMQQKLLGDGYNAILKQ